jgi:hypothetical protein
MKRIVNYFRKRYRRRLFLKIYFSILNHPDSDPPCAFLYAAEQFEEVVKVLYHSGNP